MPHRSDSSHSSSRLRHPEYYDDYYSRPHSRHSAHHHHQHRHHRSRSGSYDDLDAHTSGRSKHDSPQRSQTPSYQPHMYARPKLTYPSLECDNGRRHSTYGTVARRHHEDNDSEYGDEPPRHARVTRSNRHSTFPPSAYYSSPQQKQIQPYQQPYVHPALPPQSPSLQPAGATRQLSMQYTPRPGLAYEAPSYTYQPPTADLSRPSQPTRAESWGHSASAETESEQKSSLNRTGSRSVPPRSRSIQREARDKAKDTPHGPWEKAKKVYQSQTVNNTAELALFGLLAVAKAL